MLAIKKKREKQAKEAEAAAAAAATATDSAVDAAPTPAPAEDKANEPKRSLMGIGGKKKTSSGENGKQKGKKRTPGEIRIQKDIADLDGGEVAKVDFPNPNDLTSFNVSVTPDRGFWSGATYTFTFVIPSHYPHTPPKVTCTNKIYHPNIDLKGNVCLNILREDWKPVLDINAVIYGLIHLFEEPNPNDPLNHDAAEEFRRDARTFERTVKRTLRGAYVGSEYFEALI